MPTQDYKMTYSLHMTVGVLLANKKAKEILEKYWPKMATADNPFMLGKSPLDLRRIPGFGVSDENIEKATEELKKILL